MAHHTVILNRKNMKCKRTQPLSYKVPSYKASRVTTEIMLKINTQLSNQEK